MMVTIVVSGDEDNGAPHLLYQQDGDVNSTATYDDKDEACPRPGVVSGQFSTVPNT